MAKVFYKQIIVHNMPIMIINNRVLQQQINLSKLKLHINVIILYQYK